MNNWHQLSSDEVVDNLKSNSSTGLDSREAAERLRKWGANELIERGRKNPWQIIWEQLTELMVLILIIAALVSLALGEWIDALVILIIVVLNTLLGFSQENRAEKAIAALKKLAVPTVRVRRDGDVLEVSARELVPGDIYLLETGNKISADGRLLSSINLQVDEASLTGESEPVEKKADALTQNNVAIGDLLNMVHMGTVVTYGRGVAVVTETGMSTQLGNIAEMLQSVEREPTPLAALLHRGHGAPLISYHTGGLLHKIAVGICHLARLYVEVVL